MCACRLLFVKLKVMESMACTKIFTNWRGCSCYFVCQDENFRFWNLLFSSIRKVNHMKSVFLYYGFQHWNDVFYHFHLAIFAVESRSFRFVFKLNFASLQISITVNICQTKPFLHFLSFWVCPRFCVERRLMERKIFALRFFQFRPAFIIFCPEVFYIILRFLQSSFHDLHWNFLRFAKKNVV